MNKKNERNGKNGRRRLWRLGLLMGALALTVVVGLTCGIKGMAGLAVLPLLCSLSFYTDLPTYSFASNVADALVGYEGYPVELVAGTMKIQAFNAGIYIGDLFERLEGSQAWKVNLRGPIKKAVSSGALATPCYVTMTANGLAAAVSGNKCAGIAIYPAVCAQGDQVSYIKTDCVMP